MSGNISPVAAKGNPKISIAVKDDGGISSLVSLLRSDDVASQQAAAALAAPIMLLGSAILCLRGVVGL